MGLRDLAARIRDSRTGDTTDPLQLAREEFVAESFGPEPEDTDPDGSDLTPPAVIRPGAHTTRQKMYGRDTRRCQVAGCGTHTTGDVCTACQVAGRVPEVIPVEDLEPLPMLDQCGPGASVMIEFPT